MDYFTSQQWRIIWFSVKECSKQKTGPEAVTRMLYAMEYGSTLKKITEEDIKHLGKLVDPKKNEKGFRHIPVTVDGLVIPWENIERQIKMLLAAQDGLSPDEFYQEFENIHPFEDGNGRVGSVLFNILSNSFDNPKEPPPYRKEQ